MNKNSKIYIAGHTGMVGSSILRLLKRKGYYNIIVKSSSELNLISQIDVENFFKTHQPEYVFLAAAKVGGIHANNTFRGEFVYENIMIQSNVIHQSYLNNVKKLLFLGSSCIYPKLSKQPIKEEYLLSGKLEETNRPYAVAKITGIEMCKSYREQYASNFISLMPTNLYGPNDNYHPDNSHVFASLIRKFVIGKRDNIESINIWGSGNPKREFLHVDDLADASVFLMNNHDGKNIVNVGWGEDISIRDLSFLIKEVSGYEGEVKFDLTKPDGTPRKLLNTDRIHKLGWEPKIKLREGIKKTIEDFINNEKTYCF